MSRCSRAKVAKKSVILLQIVMVSEAQRIYVYKMGETRPQPAGETHKPDFLPISS